MIKMNPYLNFDGNTEEAFNFYRSVFGGEFSSFNKMGSIPDMEIPENEQNRVMHVALPIDEHNTLMGSDILPSAGHTLNQGNNVYITLHPETREEADRLFSQLSEGGKVEMSMADTFWGAYFGSFQDKFGVWWMINVDLQG